MVATTLGRRLDCVMGWKCSVVFGLKAVRSISDHAPPMTRHNPAAALELAAECGLGVLLPAHECDLCYGIYPHEHDEVVIAAAADGSFTSLADCKSVAGSDGVSLSPERDPRVQAMLRRHAAGVVLACELHSVTDFWGFALFERGQLVRQAAGSGDDGVLINEGSQIAEEAQLAIPAAGDHESPFDGESMVFRVAGRIFGQPLDEVPLEQWSATVFRRARPWWRFW